MNREMRAALEADGEKLRQMTGEDHGPQFLIDEPDFDDFAEECPNCGGEGWVADCFEEFACVDPESGCDLCTRRCDWCKPTPSTPKPEAAE